MSRANDSMEARHGHGALSRAKAGLRVCGRWGARLGVGLVGLVLAAAGPIWAQEMESGTINREYTIKAAYLYNFARYVSWPEKSFPSHDAPLVIGVLGEDPFGDALETIARSKRIEGRPIVLKHFASFDQYQPCHILFLAWSVGEEAESRAISRLGEAGVLLVGETPTFAERGGVVSFFAEQNKIRFEINTVAAQRQRLKISSKLLSLARLVGRAERSQTRLVDLAAQKDRPAVAGSRTASHSMQ